MNLIKNNKGITLIALAITIIVLLILAGVSIAMLTGDNGILSQAQRAKTETGNAQAEEENVLANYESYLNSYSGENTEFTDSLGNKVVVPAGFKVVNPGDNLSGVAITATLEPIAGLILVLISMFLTIIAGLIPAKMASKKDPVEALRTE